MRRCFTLLLSLLVLLPACGNAAPADEQAAEIQTLLSWTATAAMTGDAWRQGNVPTGYAGETLDTAAHALEGEQASVAQLPPVPGDMPLGERLDRVLAAIDGMRSAVQRDDRAALGGPLQELGTDADALRQSLDRLRGGP